MDLRTGEVTRLLEAEGANQSLESSSLAWSPNGDYIAYSIRDIERRELFVEVLSMRTGAKERLQNGMLPSWSPDGARLAFNAGQFPQIVVMASEGGEPSQLLSKPEGSFSGRAFSVDLRPIWSPDGLSILFTSMRVTAQDQADVRQGRTNYDVYVQGIDEDDAVRLTDSPGRDQAYDWSPDGNRFVFASDRDGNSEIYIGSLNGTERSNLTRHPGSDTQPNWGPAATVQR
jgi:Tol biopolymer transport system component|tara:strand:- start:1470 stop:2159 length:690 start_codon:yes stop_codon:yes gene_type:complete